MIALELIRENPEKIKKRYLARGKDIDFSELLQLDKQRRELTKNVEEMKAKRNKVSSEVPLLKKQGQDVSKVVAEMKELGEKIAELDKQLNVLTEKINNILLCLPNLPDEDLAAGGKENNKPIYTFGKKPTFKGFEPKNHVELCKSLGLIDYERGAKLAGNGAWIYTGDGARLEWALLNFFIDEHIKNGFQFMLVPHMLNYECGVGAGQFPKYEDDVYWIDSKGVGNKFLLPTAETALVNLYRGEILKQSELPKKFAGYTPCYRREAGSYRAEERGMIRGHQFNKVEMVMYTTKDKSDEAFEYLVKRAQNLVEQLGIHYQLVKLAAGDCADSMCRTYDIEIWIPSMGIYKECSSVSNSRDYQARRSSMKYRDEATGKTEFLHTLNGSGLATSRIIPAIVEQFQNADGSVTIPEVLRKYMGGQEKLLPKNN